MTEIWVTKLEAHMVCTFTFHTVDNDVDIATLLLYQ